jgi:two-component system, response regulator YesN
MYKVVVVEDEPLILRSIKNSIIKAHSGFYIDGEASNGEDAIDIIEKSQPDVVFTDIRMPILDGLSLVEELRKRMIQAKIIILSGYQEFDYAKRALKYGVNDYILKPIDQDYLKDLLEKIYTELENEKIENQKFLLQELINSNYYSEIPDSKLEHAFDKNLKYGFFLLCSGSYCTINLNWNTPSKNFWLRNNIQLILNKILPTGIPSWVLDYKNGNMKIIVVGLTEAANNSFSTITSELFRNLISKQFPITIVTSSLLNQLYDLPYIIQEYDIILRKNIVFSISKLVLSDAVNNDNEVMNDMIEVNAEKLLYVNYIKNFQQKQFIYEFEKILKVYEENRLPQLKLESLLKHITNLFLISGSQISQDDYIETCLEIDELISNSYNYKQVFDGMCVIYSELFDLLANTDIDRNSQESLVKEVENFIRQNYTNQISLQSIAKRFGFTLPYLSSIFKKQKGISPMKFIINLRIERAKELLISDRNLTLKDISLLTGYEDPFYLSRAFKSVTNMSPSEFKRHQNKLQ